MPKKNERILGVDPGFGRIGWGVIENKKGKWVGVAYGCIETDKKADFVTRLEEISIDLTAIIKKYKPEFSAVEELFFYKNDDSYQSWTSAWSYFTYFETAKCSRI